MKVEELRGRLSKLKRDDLIKLTVEFYKLLPKAKKEGDTLDSMINNPNEKRLKKISTTSKLSLQEIEEAVNEFIEHAKEQYYFIPNSVIHKKERVKWRFKVKNWYKELTVINHPDSNQKKQTAILSNLYELMCESCGFIYFSAYDTFQSIGIEHTEFYKPVLILYKESDKKLISVLPI